jgi:hypothetical protein
MVTRVEGFTFDDNGLLRFKNWIYVPLRDELRSLILYEARRALYMDHPRVTNMREDLKPLFLLKGMKVDIVNYAARCLECQQVKAEQRHLVGLLLSHAILDSKLEINLMDLIVGFPLMARRNETIFIVVDTPTKSAHLITVCMTY